MLARPGVASPFHCYASVRKVTQVPVLPIRYASGKCVCKCVVCVCVCVWFSSDQSLDRLGGGGRGAMRDDSAEILFHLFLLEATVSKSGIGRDVHSLILSSPLDTHRGCWPIMVQPPWPPQRCWP